MWVALPSGAREAAFRNVKTISECLADELMNAAKGSSNRWVGVGVSQPIQALSDWQCMQAFNCHNPHYARQGRVLGAAGDAAASTSRDRVSMSKAAGSRTCSRHAQSALFYTLTLSDTSAMLCCAVLPVL